jgi:hypothetical protein
VKIHLLRGRVAVRPIIETESKGGIIMPNRADYQHKDDHSQGIRAKASHFGKVLGMGPPAIGPHGHEVPHGFEPGDTINYAMHINEKACEDQVWEDGEPCIFIAQEHVNAVLD